jgi:hypothetical protein
MKKRIIYIFTAFTLLSVGCTKNLNEVNVDPTQASGANFDANLLLPSLQFNHAQANAGYNGPVLFQAGWVQVIASTTTGAANYYSNADKYVPSGNTNNYAERTWYGDYGAASYAFEIQNLVKDKPELSNLSNVAVIMQMLSLQSITDVYGDIPFTEALQAKTAGITQPKYDKQTDLYKGMLAKLETAITGLDASKAKPTNDAFTYKGDIAKWKKFGYSLMLKMAMRLVKADAATAKTYAEKAVAGGVFTSNADNALLFCDNASGFGSNTAQPFNVPADFYQVRWSRVFINKLKTTNDPRLSVIAEVPPPGLSANENLNLVGDNTPANQLGLPSGYDMNGGATDITTSAGYPGGTGSGGDLTPIGKYSRPTAIYRNRNNPYFILTYAEVELLLAEAAVRGYSVGGTASSHYQSGLSAAIQTLSAYGAGAGISAATANAYASANPLNTTSTAASLQQINEQIWLTTGATMNFSESWNNWKRSGWPVLTPVNYAGNFSGGVIPRRQPYPSAEASLNSANYAIGVSSLSGGDNWVSKVWWDQ